MSWLLPSIELPDGRARTVGEPDKREAANARSRKWYRSPRGQDWLKRTKEARSKKSNRHYHANADTRRPYLAEKLRGYRKQRREAQQ